MQAVGIAATLHNTSGLLIDNLNLIVVDHIFHIPVKKRVGLKELVYGMHTLRLDAVILEQGIFFLLLLIGREIFILHSRKLRCYVGQNKEVGIGGGAGQHFDSFIGKLY